MDEQILILIIEGFTNSYSIFLYFKKMAEKESDKAMVYKNVNRRVLILAQNGFIEEIPYTKRTPHGRIDYKLTIMGFMTMIPYFLYNPSQMRVAVEYIDRHGLDKQQIVRELIIGHSNVIDAINEFTKYSGGGSKIYSPFEKIDPELLESVGTLDHLIYEYERYDKSVRDLQSFTQRSLKYIEEGRNRLHNTIAQLKLKRVELSKENLERDKKTKKKPT